MNGWSSRTAFCLFLGLAGAALAEPPARGLRMDFYRNFYGYAPEHLALLDERNVAPDRSVVLPDARIRDPWTLKQTKNISRLCAAVVRGWMVPRTGGEYRLSLKMGQAQGRIFVSADESTAGLKEVKDGGTVSLTAGRKHALKLYWIAGHTSDKVGNGMELVWRNIKADILPDDEDDSLDLDGEAAVEMKFLPAPCRINTTTLPPFPVGGTSVCQDDDEPDALSVEFLTQDRTALDDLFAWAATNPPPLAAGTRVLTRDKVPYLRVRAGELVTDNGIWKRADLGGVPVLTGPGAHNEDESVAAIEVPADGDYRVWTRYRHGRGTCESFRLRLREDGSVFEPFDEVFARSNVHPYRPIDPIPEIQTVEPTRDGFLWEGSHRVVRLKKGRYALVFSGGLFHDRRNPEVADVLLIADRHWNPSSSDDLSYGCGTVAASLRQRSPLESALEQERWDIAFQGWWCRWRAAFLTRLAAVEHTDYVWGYLASRVYFDSELNCIARPSELAALRRYETLMPEMAARGFKPAEDAAWDFPDGRKIGNGRMAFWRSPDPWSGFTRHSPPMTGRPQWREPMLVNPVPDAEINRTMHALTARRGEVRSELLMIRNNGDDAIRFEPQVKSDLRTDVRLVACTLTSTGYWSPMVLLHRREIAAPAGRNTALWLTIDCRGASEGRHAVELEFAGRKVTWIVEVRGSIEGRGLPHFWGWCTPFARESAWRFYRDHGFDVIRFQRISKKMMAQYGIQMMMGPPCRKDLLSVPRVRAMRDELRATLGLEPEDYWWYLVDEPHTADIPRWEAMADIIKEADPQMRLWCNLGEFQPPAEVWEKWYPFMKRWDAACPFYSLFSPDPARKPFTDALRRAGRVKFLYHTLDRWGAEKAPDAPLQLIEVGERAWKENRDGWGVFTLCAGEPWDDAYQDNEDLAVSIYPGAHGETLSTRNAEAVRESLQRGVR